MKNQTDYMKGYGFALIFGIYLFTNLTLIGGICFAGLCIAFYGACRSTDEAVTNPNICCPEIKGFQN